jgi:hypothetical protein
MNGMDSVAAAKAKASAHLDARVTLFVRGIISPGALASPYCLIII